jgi:hypothetical protein
MFEMARKTRRTARLLASAAAFAACASSPGASMAAPPSRVKPAVSARCPAPSSWAVSGVAARPVVNLIQLDRAGILYWNGTPIKETMLRQFMSLVAAMTPRPQTHLEVDPAAPCADVARIVTMIGGAVDCRRSCRYRVAPWHPARPISPPAPPSPPPRFRPVTGTSPQFRPLPPPKAQAPSFRPVPGPPPPPKATESGPPK